MSICPACKGPLASTSCSLCEACASVFGNGLCEKDESASTPPHLSCEVEVESPLSQRSCGGNSSVAGDVVKYEEQDDDIMITLRVKSPSTEFKQRLKQKGSMMMMLSPEVSQSQETCSSSCVLLDVKTSTELAQDRLDKAKEDGDIEYVASSQSQSEQTVQACTEKEDSRVDSDKKCVDCGANTGAAWKDWCLKCFSSRKHQDREQIESGTCRCCTGKTLSVDFNYCSMCYAAKKKENARRQHEQSVRTEELYRHSSFSPVKCAVCGGPKAESWMKYCSDCYTGSPEARRKKARVVSKPISTPQRKRSKP